MSGNGGRCGRLAAIIEVCAAGALTAGVVSGCATAAPQAQVQPQAQARVSSQAPAQSHSQAQAQAQQSQAQQQQSRAPAQQSRAQVPWSAVGSGWELVQYANGTSAKHAATTLYLVSPQGTRYPLYTWRASASFPPSLIAWSGDKTRALFYRAPNGPGAQLNLRTGKLTQVSLAGNATPVGYTLPDGLNILGIRVNGAVTTLARYALTGTLAKVLASGRTDMRGAYAAGGTTLAVSGANGLRLVSNAGAVIRQLPVPGADPRLGCLPVRWWSAGTILAQCAGRLWLVPASGARPAALTPHRTSGSDLGDIDAWRLTSGLYLQSLGACGTLEFNKQAAGGSVAPVTVPGTLNVSTRIVTALGPRLLIDALTGCGGSQSLLWFNPGSRAEQWLFKTPASAFGVLAVIPYNGGENAPTP